MLIELIPILTYVILLFFRHSLISECWTWQPKLRPTFHYIMNFFETNPRIVVPCLDVPSASVEITDGDPTTNHLRKMSAPNRAGGIANVRQRNTSPVDSLPSYHSGGVGGCGLSSTSPMSNCESAGDAMELSAKCSSITAPSSSMHHHHRSCNTIENGSAPAMEPLLPLTKDSYITRYALMQRTRSPDAASIERSPPTGDPPSV